MSDEIPPGPPELALDAHKGRAGRLLALAGSPTMPGAAVLVATAAQRAGCGLVEVALEFGGPAAAALGAAAPECILRRLDGAQDGAQDQGGAGGWPPSADAALAGPGLGTGDAVRARVEGLLAEFEGPLLLDADALNVFEGRAQELRRPSGELVLTPHPGEARRLLGRDVPGDGPGRVAAARELAETTGAVCVLKGQHSVIASPDRFQVNHSGSPAMATAGAGDVLSGVLGAYLAAWRAAGGNGAEGSAFDAALAAVWVHGRAGEVCEERFGVRGTIARDLIDALPEAAAGFGYRRR